MSLIRSIRALALTLLLAAPAFAQSPSVPRVLGLTGAPNFRDLGGYATGDGHHVRYGLVFRSNNLSSLTPHDEATIAALHITTEIDLRTREERLDEPSRWSRAPAHLYESPKPTLRALIGPLFAQIHDGPSARHAFTGLYAQMPDLYRPEYAALFRRMLAGETPMVIHCTAGKDRTGVAAAVFLTSLGVPRPTVVADYALSEKLLPPLPAKPAPGAPIPPGSSKAMAAINKLPEDARVEIWRSEPAYIEAALDSIDREYGSVDGYLRKGLGLSERQIRELRAKFTQE